jgi:hypothetical protein
MSHHHTSPQAQVDDLTMRIEVRAEPRAWLGGFP